MPRFPSSAGCQAEQRDPGAVAEARLRRLGVAYAPVLVALAEDDGLTQAEIAQRTHIEQPTAAALLQRMAKPGLLDRSPHPSDRRASRIALPARSVELLPQAPDRLTRTNDEATAGLTAREVATLHDLLGRVLDNLDGMIETPKPSTSTSRSRASRR